MKLEEFLKRAIPYQKEIPGQKLLTFGDIWASMSRRQKRYINLRISLNKEPLWKEICKLA